MPPWTTTVWVQNMPHQSTTLSYTDSFELWHLKNSKGRKTCSLNPAYLPNDRFSKRNPILINSFLGNSINQGKWALITWEETRHWQHCSNYHKSWYLPSVLLRVHSSSLETIYSSLRHQPSLLSLLKWYWILIFMPLHGSY